MRLYRPYAEAAQPGPARNLPDDGEHGPHCDGAAVGCAAGLRSRGPPDPDREILPDMLGTMMGFASQDVLLGNQFMRPVAQRGARSGG